MGLEFHRKLRDGFLEIAKREAQRCVVIDATAPIEAVHRAIRHAVGERLGVAL
jgi:dTMP kinase